MPKIEVEKTAWHMAAENTQLGLLYIMWEWTVYVLTLEKLNHKLFLNKDIWDDTAWHMAAKNGQLELLHLLWECAKDVLMPEEVKNILSQRWK